MPPSNTADRSCLDPGSAEMPSPFGADNQFFHLESNQPFPQTKEADTRTRKKAKCPRPSPSSSSSGDKQQATSSKPPSERRRSVSREGLPSYPNRRRGATSQIRHPAPDADRRPCPAVPGSDRSLARSSGHHRRAAAHSSGSSLSLTGLWSHKQETRAVSSVGPVA